MYLSGTSFSGVRMAALPQTFSEKDDKNSFNVSIEYWVLMEEHIHGANTSLRTAIRLIIGFEPENIDVIIFFY